MKFIYWFFTLTIFSFSCNTKQSKLTSSTWLLKEYNSTTDSKITLHDKASFYEKYKYDFTITFFDDNSVMIGLEEKLSIKLSWKWINNKEEILIFRDNNFDKISKFEIPFYGEYFVNSISKRNLKLNRLIIPFEDEEEFIFEKLE